MHWLTCFLCFHPPVATTLFLLVSFEDIKGLNVEYYFDTLNSEAYQEALSNDVSTHDHLVLDQVSLLIVPQCDFFLCIT